MSPILRASNAHKIKGLAKIANPSPALYWDVNLKKSTLLRPVSTYADRGQKDESYELPYLFLQKGLLSLYNLVAGKTKRNNTPL